jgi:hypothetical protein
MRGSNRVRFTGRVHGRSLTPGVYRITVVTVRPKARKAIGTTQVAVGANAPNAASVHFDCTTAPTLGVLPFLASLVAPPTAGEAAVHQAGTKAAVATRDASTSVIAHLPKLPRPPLPSFSQPGFSNVRGIAAIAVMLLALGTMGFLVVRFVRGSWNP